MRHSCLSLTSFNWSFSSERAIAEPHCDYVIRVEPASNAFGALQKCISSSMTILFLTNKIKDNKDNKLFITVQHN